MTDNTKMRDGRLWAFLHDSIHEAYKKLSTTGTSNEYHALLDSVASKVADDVDARFLQAAQAELQDLRMCKIAAREEARRVDELTTELGRLRKDVDIAVETRNIALNALQEIIDLDYHGSLAYAKLTAVKAMVQVVHIAAIAGEKK